MSNGWLGTEPWFGLPLADLWFILVFVLLGTFLLLDGFDFGVGMLYGLRRDGAVREQLLTAVSPFWDANEVWLVVFGGALFAGFPSVYTNLFSRYYLLMFGVLLALILRGLSTELIEARSGTRWTRLWQGAFVVGSIASPLLLGVFAANWLIGAQQLQWLPGLVVGLTLCLLCLVDGVAYLGFKAPTLRPSLARYGSRAIVGYLAGVVITLGYLYVAVTPLSSVVFSPIVIGLVVLSIAFAGVYVVALGREQYRTAFLSVAGLVYGFVGVVVTVMHPMIDRAVGLTVSEAVVSPLALNLLTLVAVVTLPFITVYFVVLYSVFRGPASCGESY
ncbi:cytochrome d ubiquinol oxidase subunit II [Halocatena halophila]|uniref:cytochrome d ubiquinol oxidase subunit II n=1 Tax=Halocatena halophila TaxID=2814576 RepID=UPI002ED25F60